MGRREDNKRRTRQALIETALVLFRRHGFGETRVQDIVERVGVSPATFFNYFPSKDAILEAQADESADLYAALLRHERDRTDATVADRLLQITRVIAQTLGSDPEISRLMVTRTALFFGSIGARADRDRDSQQLLAEVFAQGQASGEINRAADPLQLAELFTAAITLPAINWLIEWWGPNEQTLEDRLVGGVTTLLNGALA